VAYQLQSTPTFDKAFKRLDAATARPVAEKLRWLTEHPEALRHPLHHLPADLHGLQKYRVGDWRVLFWVDHAKRTITLYTVEHRSRIYRQF
jgi:mRNA interferase RelE/StbE